MTPARPDSVRAFLESLGLQQYAPCFDQQAIELDLLPDLTDAQLQRIGVQAMGHRLKLMRAAAGLAVAASPPATAWSADADRRQITVLFCDLVGADGLSDWLDPEDLGRVTQQFRQAAAAVVERHGGLVAQWLADGLMAYFGWPRAHEDDPSRAVAAGLQLVEAMATLAVPRRLRARVGIATGAVVVGSLAPAAGGAGALEGPIDPAQLRLAVGETPNLAARVRDQAEPDQVVVAALTRELIGRAFDCIDLGTFAIKGLAEPARLWRVTGESGADGRFDASHPGTLTALVNRELEMALLMDRWDRACAGRGQVVVLTGEPGIGKSRVLAELIERLPRQDLMLRLQCSALHAHSAFHPFIVQLRRAARIERQDDAEVALDKLETLLARLGPGLRPQARLFAQLLSLPLARYAPLAASPARIKQDTIAAIVQAMLETVARRPVLLVAEDVHWMDPSSLEALEAMVGALGRAGALLVMTSRVPLAARWSSLPHVTALTLVGLNRTHSLQLATAVAAAQGFGRSLLERIVDRTDGVPLFLEELTRTVVARAANRVDALAEGMAIPDTLKDSLAARLDSLGPARRVAQLGALLGRQFRHGVLAALHGGTTEALAGAVGQALESGLIGRRGTGADAVYTFHHALIQDAAYESLLHSEQRHLHARAAEVLQAQSPEMAEHEPEQLARHCSAGGVWARAVPLWLKAGQRAWARSAAQEAIAHLQAGLAAVVHLPDGRERREVELRLQSTLGVVSFAAVSYAAPQTQQAFERAVALCESMDDIELTFPVHFGMGSVQVMKGDVRAGHAVFERMAERAAASGVARLQMGAQTVLAWSQVALGEFEAGLAAADAAQRGFDRGAMAGARLTAAHPMVIAGAFRAIALWAMGRIDAARDASDAVLAQARACGEAYSLTYALCFGALMVPVLDGDAATVAQRVAEGRRLAEDMGYPFLGSNALALRAASQAREPDLDLAQLQAALADLDAALAEMEAVGVRFHHVQCLAARSRLLRRLGQCEAARSMAQQALEAAERSGIRWNLPDAQLALGEAWQATGPAGRDAARRAFEQAAEQARALGARSWQARAQAALLDAMRTGSAGA